MNALTNALQTIAPEIAAEITSAEAVSLVAAILDYLDAYQPSWSNVSEPCRYCDDYRADEFSGVADSLNRAAGGHGAPNRHALGVRVLVDRDEERFGELANRVARFVGGRRGRSRRRRADWVALRRAERRKGAARLRAEVAAGKKGWNVLLDDVRRLVALGSDLCEARSRSELRVRTERGFEDLALRAGEGVADSRQLDRRLERLPQRVSERRKPVAGRLDEAEASKSEQAIRDLPSVELCLRGHVPARDRLAAGAV